MRVRVRFKVRINIGFRVILRGRIQYIIVRCECEEGGGRFRVILRGRIRNQFMVNRSQREKSRESEGV